MANANQCAFCDATNLQSRTIRTHQLFLTIVSDPSFRRGHCLVVPRWHITQLSELEAEERAAIMLELGRLSAKLDEGYGSGIMQKYQPRQAENGIKVNHLHFHVFPRFEHEAGLFPTPEPNDFPGFSPTPEAEVARLVELLQ